MLSILCGFESEAKVARLLTPLVECSGAREDVARAKAEEMIKKGATTMLSFGVAGGLSPQLHSRMLIIGDRVAGAGGQSWRCDEKFSALLARAIPAAKKGSVYGSAHLVPDPAQKKNLFAQSGCLIVDMESHVVAEAATRHNIRFAVLRGLSDVVDEDFPEAALKGINPDGSINLAATLLSVLKNPAQIPALMSLHANTNWTLKRLKQAVPALLPLLAQY